MASSGPSPAPPSPLGWVGLVAAVVGVKLVLATRWDLLADEAYYAVWSEHLALGYYDQPPLIAWSMALARALGGDSDLAVRLPAVLAGVVVTGALLPAAGDRMLWAAWSALLPPLFWLTTFSTPDAPLLACVAVALGGALAGGRGWLLAGGALGIGLYAKYTAGLFLILLPWAFGAWRERSMWAGWALAAAMALPHLGWLATHDFVSLGFAFTEGAWHPHSPGWTGPVAVLGQQVGVATPFGVLVAVGLLARGEPALRRMIAALGAFFGVASFGGPPEAHWLAPLWILVGIGASRAKGWIPRGAWIAVGVAIAVNAFVIAQAERPVVRLPLAPENRVREGRLLAAGVAQWALPEGVGMREPGAKAAIPVLTERYQEAALVRWYAGIDAWAYPGCARPDQYDLWPRKVPERFLFVRPATSGDATCADPANKRRHRVRPLRADGVPVGTWDLFEVER